MGASSRSPSPITTVPRTSTLSNAFRIAVTAAWSAAFLSPRPIQRAQASAASSVMRTNSRPTCRSMSLLPGGDAELARVHLFPVVQGGAPAEQPDAAGRLGLRIDVLDVR